MRCSKGIFNSSAIAFRVLCRESCSSIYSMISASKAPLNRSVRLVPWFSNCVGVNVEFMVVEVVGVEVEVEVNV